MLRGSRQRILGVIALLAIAMQMVLLFAHTHVGASHLSGFDAASINCPDSTGTSCSAPANHPADHDQDEAACLVCLAAHQTAATVLAAAPEVACPRLTPSAFRPLYAAPAHAATKAANFYARGPPAA